ncbi:MAG: hypothetical protein ABSA53_21470 [Streptosporangiaceae bacterium]
MSIRDLRGGDLQEKAQAGEPLAVTNYRVLIGVIIPVSPAWVEQLVVHNWSRVGQSIAEGERAMTDAMAWSDGARTEEGGTASDPPGRTRAPGRRPAPLAAAMVGDAVVQTPESKSILDQLHAVFNPAAASENRPTASAVVRPIRIGDLSAAQIEKAGAGRETLAITHDRKLIGILIPVTQDLVQFLIEQNMTSVLDNIWSGEKKLKDAVLLD